MSNANNADNEVEIMAVLGNLAYMWNVLQDWTDLTEPNGGEVPEWLTWNCFLNNIGIGDHESPKKDCEKLQDFAGFLSLIRHALITSTQRKSDVELNLTFRPDGQWIATVKAPNDEPALASTASGEDWTKRLLMEWAFECGVHLYGRPPDVDYLKMYSLDNAICVECGKTARKDARGKITKYCEAKTPEGHYRCEKRHQQWIGDAANMRPDLRAQEIFRRLNKAIEDRNP